MPADCGISVFFPAYNDAPSLPGLIENTFKTLNALDVDCEVIVVNDGSQDETPRVLAQLQGIWGPRLKIVTHPENRGYGGALRSGFANAARELIFYTDGDGQYDPSEVEVLVDRATVDTDVVQGWKPCAATGGTAR